MSLSATSTCLLSTSRNAMFFALVKGEPGRMGKEELLSGLKNWQCWRLCCFPNAIHPIVSFFFCSLTSHLNYPCSNLNAFLFVQSTRGTENCHHSLCSNLCIFENCSHGPASLFSQLLRHFEILISFA